MAEELKACPCCRGEARLSNQPTHAATLEAMVSCRSCGLSVQKKTRIAAIAAWNTRPLTGVTEEMLAAAREVADGVDDSAFERIYLAMSNASRGG
jgi:hypothetical protein